MTPQNLFEEKDKELPIVSNAHSGALIYSSLNAVMEGIGFIGKGRDNKIQNYAFRGIDDIYNALHAILAKCKVFCVPEVLEQVREERQTKNGGTLIYTILKVKYTFYAVDGSSVSATLIGEAMDSSDKGSNKAMSAAQKYAFLQIFCIPTVEQKDSEYEDHDVAPKFKPGPEKPSAIAPTTGIGMAYGSDGSLMGGLNKNYGPNDKITPGQAKRFWAVGYEHKWTAPEMLEMLINYGYESADKILLKHYDEIIEALKK